MKRKNNFDGEDMISLNVFLKDGVINVFIVDTLDEPRGANKIVFDDKNASGICRLNDAIDEFLKRLDLPVRSMLI